MFVTDRITSSVCYGARSQHSHRHSKKSDQGADTRRGGAAARHEAPGRSRSDPERQASTRTPNDKATVSQPAPASKQTPVPRVTTSTSNTGSACWFRVSKAERLVRKKPSRAARHRFSSGGLAAGQRGGAKAA